MEAKRFKDGRDAKLAEFQSEYDKLRTQYSSALLAAIQEEDSENQQELIQEVLTVNTQMTELVRDILGVLNQGSKTIDTSILDNLTQDLIEYQKQHTDIQESKDKMTTLKMIQGATKEKIDNANQMFMFYLFGLLALIFFVGYLAIRTPGYFTVPTILPSTLPVVR